MQNNYEHCLELYKVGSQILSEIIYYINTAYISWLGFTAKIPAVTRNNSNLLSLTLSVLTESQIPDF